MKNLVDQQPRFSSKKSTTHIDRNELLRKREILSKICSQINPYRKLTKEEKQELKQFNLHLQDDPFLLTNQLLLLLDQITTELSYNDLLDTNKD